MNVFPVDNHKKQFLQSSELQPAGSFSQLSQFFCSFCLKRVATTKPE